MSAEVIARVSATEREIELPDGTCALVDDNTGWALPLNAPGKERAK